MSGLYLGSSCTGCLETRDVTIRCDTCRAHLCVACMAGHSHLVMHSQVGVCYFCETRALLMRCHSCPYYFCIDCYPAHDQPQVSLEDLWCDEQLDDVVPVGVCIEE